MIGRENKKSACLRQHAFSCKGEFRAALLSGLPCIDKSRLIQELEIPIITSRGYFSSGKFDQCKKDVPYSTLIQAFTNYIRIILTEDKKRVEYWKKIISEAIKINGRLISDLIPELKLIIGKQPEVQHIPLQEKPDIDSIALRQILFLLLQGPITHLPFL